MVERMIDAGGWSLLHSLWQIALVALLLPPFLRRLPAAAHHRRYLYACTALLLALTIPLTGFVASMVRPAAGAVQAAPLASSAAPAPTAVETPVAAAVAGWNDSVAPSVPWLPVVWVTGVLLLCARWLDGAWRLRRLVRGTQPVPCHWRRRIAALVRQAGLPREIPVRLTDALDAPVLVGWLRPLILLPAGAVGRVPDRFVEAALLHELMHVRRCDPWVHRAQLLARTLLFFHPGVWWLSHRIGIEREHACDDAVVTVTDDRLGYARALAGLEACRGELTSHALSSNGGSLMNRIEKIVSTRSGVSARRSGAAALAAGVLALGLVAAALVATPEIAADDASIAWLPESVQRWESQIETAAEAHGVDASLLAVMTLVESLGHPEAESSHGALGLMQVMPSTGARIARARGIEGFTVDRLRDPQTNLDFGAWYLARQMSDFGKRAEGAEAVRLAVAAYNGGPEHLEAHLRDGVALREETRKYATLVVQLWNDRDAAASPAYEQHFKRRTAY